MMPFAKKSTGSIKIKALLGAIVLLAGAGCDMSAGQTADIDEATDPASAAANASAQAATLTTDLDKASYAMGFSVADNVAQNVSDSLNVVAFVQGVEDRFANRALAISEAEASAALQSLMAVRQNAITERGAENLRAGSDFLETNAARDGIVTLPSGLQYKVLTAAEGAKPVVTATVTTHYHGTLIDGTVFDSSYERGEPASFAVNGVIAGWTQALQLMAVGAKWRLFIPPDLAYGAADRGSIPANSTLIFDVELLEIQTAE